MKSFIRAIVIIVGIFLISCSDSSTGSDNGGDTTYSVDVSITPTDAGTISPSTHKTYNEGDVIELEAKATDLYTFLHWSGDVDSTSDNPLNLTVEQDLSLTAHFQKKGEESLFYLADNGITIKCDEAEVGDTGTVNGVTYTKRDADQITTTNTETTCTSGVTIMTNMFKGFSSFDGDISSWDVSNVTRMDFMFREASPINVDLSNWDVSNVTNMKGMFSKTNASTVIGDISNWDVSSVTNMNAMFAQNGDFNQDISGWDVSNVTIMKAMFLNNSSFNADLSNWDVGNVTTMEQTFRGASSFNADVGDWEVGNVTNMQNMFRDASSFNSDIGDWDVSSVTNMKVMFANASAFDQDISGWCVSNIPSEPTSFALNTPIENSPDKKPTWGTCPNN